MGKKIEPPAVQRNVDTFFKILNRVKAKPTPTTLVFQAWIHRQTGEVKDHPPSLDKKEWEQMEINCTYDTEKKEIRFKEGSQPPLHPLARRVFKEALHIFQNVSKTFRGEDFAVQMQHLSTFSDSTSVVSDDRLIASAWHGVDRSKAEELLGIERKDPLPQGTYLFRKDSFAEILEQQLRAKRGGEITCLTLTVLGSLKKVSDYTLVQIDGSWQIYNDDPQLQQRGFPSLTALLKAKKNLFIHPLYA
jgi:hypothetical protein